MNNDDHESPGMSQLEVAIKAMKATDASAMPDELIRQTRAAMLQSSRPRDWRTHALRIASAAVIALVLLGFAVVMMQTTPSQALAEVAGRVNATKTMRAVLTDPGGQGRLVISGSRRRFERSDAVVFIADSASRREVMIDSNRKWAERGSVRATSPALDFYGIFRELAGASTPIKEYVDKAGRHYSGLLGQASLKIDRDTTWKVNAKIWSDPTTKLPVRLELELPVRLEGRQVMILLEQIEFDVPLDDSLFEMTVPAEYTVVGVFPDQIKPAPSASEAAKLTIVPGVGIGEVKFGMSREQIVAVLGEPEFTIGDSYLCYPSKGLQLVLVGREPDKLGMIIANPMDAASLTRNEFPGQTDKGIRMGSSEEEVRDAYGQPDPPLPSENPRPRGSKVARYRYNKPALGFDFVDGKVQQIIAARTD